MSYGYYAWLECYGLGSAVRMIVACFDDDDDNDVPFSYHVFYDFVA